MDFILVLVCFSNLQSCNVLLVMQVLTGFELSIQASEGVYAGSLAEAVVLIMFLKTT